jgi:hypothetical protein
MIGRPRPCCASLMCSSAPPPDVPPSSGECLRMPQVRLCAAGGNALYFRPLPHGLRFVATELGHLCPGSGSLDSGLKFGRVVKLHRARLKNSEHLPWPSRNGNIQADCRRVDSASSSTPAQNRRPRTGWSAAPTELPLPNRPFASHFTPIASRQRIDTRVEPERQPQPSSLHWCRSAIPRNTAAESTGRPRCREQ